MKSRKCFSPELGITTDMLKESRDTLRHRVGRVMTGYVLLIPIVALLFLSMYFDTSSKALLVAGAVVVLFLLFSACRACTLFEGRIPRIKSIGLNLRSIYNGLKSLACVAFLLDEESEDSENS